MTKPTTRTQSDILASYIADADVAADAVKAAAREMGAECAQRIRMIRDLKLSLHIARSRPESELFDAAASISPDMLRILSNPTHSL